MQYVLITTNYGPPVYAAKNYTFTDKVENAIKWTLPNTKAMEDINKVMKESFHYKEIK